MRRSRNHPDLRAALIHLRAVRGWTQEDLARASGVPASSISDYELGKKNPSPRSLERLTEALGLSGPVLDFVVSFTRSLRAVVASPGKSLAAGTPARVAALAAEVAQLAARFAAPSLALAAVELEANAAGRGREPAPPTEGDRSEARRLWALLEPLSLLEQRACLRELPEFRNWALCELLCAESIRAAAADSSRALELAELALLLAEVVPGEDGWHARVAAYCLGHVGNAHRAAGDLLAAEAAFVRAAGLWRPEGVSGKSLLDGTRLLDLEAAFRRAQRCAPEAPDLRDRRAPACFKAKVSRARRLPADLRKAPPR